MLDSDTNMGARTNAINGTPGHAGPHKPNHAEGPWGSSSPVRARSRGSPWRLNGRAVDVLWIKGVSARFETVSWRIREKDFVNSGFDDSYQARRFDVNSSEAEREMRERTASGRIYMQWKLLVKLRVSTDADLERSFKKSLATDAKEHVIIRYEQEERARRVSP